MTYAQLDSLIEVETRGQKKSGSKKPTGDVFAEVAMLQRLGGGARG